MQSHKLGEQHDLLTASDFIESNLSLFPFQLFQLCFTHFGPSENLQVFLERTRDKMITSVNKQYCVFLMDTLEAETEQNQQDWSTLMDLSFIYWCKQLMF